MPVGIHKIETIIQTPDPAAARRVQRKDDKLSEEEKERLARKRRERAKKESARKSEIGHSGAEGDVDIRV